MACSDFQWRGGLALTALFGGGMMLSACSGGISNPLPSVTGALPGWFSSSPGAATAQAAAAVPGSRSMDNDCPTVDVRRGASTLAIATKTEGATANDLRYQLSFSETARQCTLVNNTVSMRIGVQGRIVVGPAGAPSEVGVPLRYAVIREGVEPKTIATKFKRFSVAVPAGQTYVTFTDVDDSVSFPLPSPTELDAYVVYVGYDDLGDRDQRRQPAKKGPPRKK
jgi:hypothetical protein